ncbi:putative E3 ubiquitin-protein ligase [Armadillidium nasatum]|uniref:RBR-type E3 ubiquitin transferase n=1 Tax=Armadillidium nasatum TaxID=96803 RepID=A0A5N5T3V6_9CRUS|nr:putative E3 ubiquitin-protein ligase [Armadillidium nasatum]
MPSLLTLLRPDSVPTSTQIPKDVSSRSLNSYTAPTQDVRKCHTMVSLSMNSNGSNVATTTKVMKDRKPRFGFLRRISSSKSAIFTPKTATLHSSSLRKSPSATQAIHKFRKNSTTEMWPHPEHPEEGNSCSLSYEVDNFASVDKFIDSSSDEGKFGAGCSRCTSSTSCMCTYTTLKIREGESIIECPDFNCDCKGEITLEEIDSLVGKELLNLHLKFRRNKEIESDPYKTWCPRPGCDSVVTLSNSKLERTQLKSATCHKCKTVFCSACSNAWHPGKTCLRVAEHFGLTFLLIFYYPNLSGNVPFNDIIKRCPRCKVPIERDAGCAQMQCKKCKHVFCWYCLVSLEVVTGDEMVFYFQDDFLLRHYDKGPCKNKLGHSRASVLWHRAQVIIIFAGFGLLLVIASPLLLFVGPCLLCRSCRPCNGSSGSSSSNSSIHDSDEGSTGIF